MVNVIRMNDQKYTYIIRSSFEYAPGQDIQSGEDVLEAKQKVKIHEQVVEDNEKYLDEFDFRNRLERSNEHSRQCNCPNHGDEFYWNQDDAFLRKYPLTIV